MDEDLYRDYRLNTPLNKSRILEPIYEKNQEFIELYWRAWEIAWQHVVHREDMPQKLYLDEAMKPSTIWIWDTCFMVLYCKYAPKIFPGIESLNNFYKIIHDKIKAPAKIHFADNPPLFAWVEWEYYKITGDIERLKWVEGENKYLSRHFEFIETSKPMKRLRSVHVPLIVRKDSIGYKWRGNTSGMDNTPRGRNRWNNTKYNPRGQINRNNIYWLDLLSQQALAADCISKIAKELGDNNKEVKFRNLRDNKKEILNQYYWNEEEGIYYDIFKWSEEKIETYLKDGKEIHNKVPTIASYWPLLAKISDDSKAKQLADKAKQKSFFGGEIPWPSLARIDPEYVPKGRYWRGGVWLPTAYMATKGLDNYNFHEIANENAEKLLLAMVNTYNQFEPHTIWEVYSPEEFKPSSMKRNEPDGARPDFCGWSALGPISMLIENILGFHEINAVTKEIFWEIHQTCKHGLLNLNFGEIQTDLIYEKGKILVKSNNEYKLKIINQNGKVLTELHIGKGEQNFPFDFE